ncbi:protein TAPETUM DETERMINANT 1 [Solanum dulcamara]|uniref:protein TAPETUM DETERMINANT 1 n=1 Tax=Solanum dulcamara TaxID=45834 RepID=UPI002485D454|nr:protein TAPETUM DETERMINANT 1 [Solanum dulcamara]
MSSQSLKRRIRIGLTYAVFAFFLLLIIRSELFTGRLIGPNFMAEPNSAVTENTNVGPHRKLLNQENEVETNRIWGDKCSKSDIVINQGPTAPLPSGIPTYTVEIMNVCVSGCDISGIHLSCGWFSSARLINPRIFKRLHFDDCLVNDGKPLINGHTISFQYANTFRYPLSVSSVVC